MLLILGKKKTLHEVVLGRFCTGGNHVRRMHGLMGVLALRGNYQDDEESVVKS